MKGEDRRGGKGDMIQQRRSERGQSWNNENARRESAPCCARHRSPPPARSLHRRTQTAPRKSCLASSPPAPDTGKLGSQFQLDPSPGRIDDTHLSDSKQLKILKNY